VNFAGHPGTLGAAWADYILADRVVVPPGGEQHFSEAVVRLPDCYLPSDTRYEVEAAPTRIAAGLPEQGFVFCSFNSTYKITPAMFDIWMRLLRQTPGSVLWLLAENGDARRHLAAEAEARGVPPDRLVFAGRLSRAAYLGRLRFADCFLDALPCNAHTTCSDALWMGLPVVTCMGRSLAARVAGSMLTAIGLPELIAADMAGYEALALSLAREPDRLKTVRDKLAANRASQPLFDIARLARNIESAYQTMGQRQREGLPPAGFSVPG
jgi:predicted O-linked N-acetylglucosamine transferase (SPINDLY family)